MRKKNNSTKQKPRKGFRGTKKPTPFADVGQIAGRAVGSFFGLPQASGIGRWLGSGIGSIFGSGDYQMVGTDPGYNLLTNGRQIPQFGMSDRTNIICHREYLGDVDSTINFTNSAYNLNPTDSKTFPWLSGIAPHYQQYRFHGIIFEFRPMTTDYAASGIPGVVVFATNYNAAEPVFASKVEMENSEFAVSVKPTQALMHAIECAVGETTITRLYTDKDANKDARFTDLGVTQFATTGSGVNGLVLGELWVSYCIEFFKPKLVPEIGGVLTAHIERASCTAANPLGTIGITEVGDLKHEITADLIRLFVSPSTKWLIQVAWVADVTAVVTPVAPVLLGAVYGPWDNRITGGASFFSIEPATTTRRFTFQAVITVDTNVDQAVINFDGCFAALPTTNANVDIVVTQVDRETE
jgi:hypothetical protein